MADTDMPNTNGSGPLPTRLDMGIRTRLSLMMFLQYAIWGAWWSVLSKYLGSDGIEFTAGQIGAVYSTSALASMISPLIFGQIADRWVSTELLLGILHLLGAGALFLATKLTDFSSFYACVLTWALLYFPTLTLTNSLSFHHISDVGKYFPGIRVFGTIGWIVAGLCVGVFKLNEESVEPIYLAMAFSAVMGIYCFMLPHTPPSGKGGSAFPALRAVGLLKDPSFTVFILVSFVIAIVLAGYFVFTPPFLGHVAAQTGATYLDHAAPVMTIGQMFEMVFMLLLPFFLKYLGMKWTLAMGMLAWALRYAAFAIGAPAALILVGVALHGICYDFFFVAAYIHTDNQASGDMRASAQGLFNFVVMGVGIFIGSNAFGWLVGHFTTNDVTAWRSVWAYPAIGALIAMLLLLVAFREKKSTEPASTV